MMRVPLRHGPSASALFADYLESRSRVQQFYPHDYSLDAIKAFAGQRAPLDADHRRRLCAVLGEQQAAFGAGTRGVEKLAAGAVAVVTGQQPVLFTGPLFSILKAITAIRIAEELETAGIRAAPVFWVAAEDHDREEIEPTWILDRDSKLCRIAVDLDRGEPTPAGWVEYRDDVRDAVANCLQSLPSSEFIPDLASMLEHAYRPGISPVTAFARMMAKLFPGAELTFVNPLHDELRAIAQPTIDAAVQRNSTIRARLIARNQSLEAAGYHQQVKVDGNFTGLFGFRGRSRQALRPEELGNGIRWSPNVLLRPVFQDALFPTVAYIAGPAEIAYFAQAAAVYEALGRQMPPIFPRISATVVEPRVARILGKYGMEFAEVYRGRDYLKRRAVGSLEDGDAFERARSRIEGELELLRPTLDAADSTLAGALDTSRQKILHQVEALRGKYVNAVARRDEALERHLDAICNSLFPGGKPQERMINVTSFLARYGPGIVRKLQETLSLDTREHQVVEI